MAPNPSSISSIVFQEAKSESNQIRSGKLANKLISGKAELCERAFKIFWVRLDRIQIFSGQAGMDEISLSQNVFRFIVTRTANITAQTTDYGTWN